MRLRRAPAGEGRGGVDRADPRPDPAVALGPADARRPGAGGRRTWRPAVGDDTYPRINWVWFRLVVQTFLRSVGGPHSLAEMAADLATHDSFARADGWLSDGADRAYDHYVGWALHLYPTLWARMAGAGDLAAAAARTRPPRCSTGSSPTRVALVGADGSPLIQGRSLIYRFAAAAPFWVGALAGVPSVPPGQLRRAANRHRRPLRRARGAGRARPAHHGLARRRGPAGAVVLRARLARTGRPRACSASPCRPTIQCGQRRRSRCPSEDGGDAAGGAGARAGSSASTPDDGIVRVVNHGTDHAVEGATVADSPLYARLGYSTATSPGARRARLGRAGRPVGDARRRRRPGHPPQRHAHPRGARRRRRPGASASPARPPTPTGCEPDPAAPDHGEGRPGRRHPAGRLTVVLARARAWEVRLSRVDGLAGGVDPAPVRLRIGGWPVAGADPRPRCDTGGGRRAVARGCASRLVALSGPAATAGVAEYDDASPLGPGVRVPWLEYPVAGRRLGARAGRTAAAPPRSAAGRPADRRRSRPTAGPAATFGSLARRRAHINTDQRQTRPPLRWPRNPRWALPQGPVPTKEYG